MAGQKGRSGGRNRKPTKLHVVQGTYQPSRHNPKEPKPEQGIPRCPVGLSKKARKYWKEFALELDAMQVLTKADKYALRLLSEAFTDYDQALEDLRNQPRIYAKKDNKGRTTSLAINPNVRLLRDTWNQIMIALREFGLTPSSRGRVSANPQKSKENKFDNLGNNVKRNKV